jgi:hypothetical protein
MAIITVMQLSFINGQVISLAAGYRHVDMSVSVAKAFVLSPKLCYFSIMSIVFCNLRSVFSFPNNCKVKSIDGETVPPVTAMRKG